MSVVSTARRWLAARLIRHAERRLRQIRPDWADAMIGETRLLESDGERLRWAAGCALASYRTPESLAGAAYPAALLLGIAGMAGYQWSADESLRTLVLLGLVGLIVGVVGPRRVLVSGIAIGLVVAAVNGFETISGLRPAYETKAHSLAHDARWLVMVAPALLAATVGGALGQWLRLIPRRRR